MSDYAANTRAALQSVVDHLTYKPGWKFFVVPRAVNSGVGPYVYDDEFTVTIMVTYRVADVTTGELVDLQQSKAIYVPTSAGWRGDTGWALEMFRNLIQVAERHEFEEWLKWDDQCVVDPHPERVGGLRWQAKT